MTDENRFIARAQWHAAEGSWTDGPARYLMLRADTLMGMFRRLPPEARQSALDAIAAATVEAGGESLRRYRDAAGLTAAELAPMIERTAAELGWGRLEIALGEGMIAMTVHHSPFALAAAPADGPVCAPLAGILSAFAAIALGRPARAREVACAATGTECCRFEVERL